MGEYSIIPTRYLWINRGVLRMESAPTRHELVPRKIDSGMAVIAGVVILFGIASGIFVAAIISLFFCGAFEMFGHYLTP